WTDNGGCAVYGCSMVPKTEALKPLEIPPAFWGREDKDCPECGKSIMAMAVRCRHCGAQVEAKIEEKTAYQQRKARKARAPKLRQMSIVFLVLSLLPFLSVVPALGGALYYRSHRDDIRRLPGSYAGYYRISIAVGAAHLAIFAIALLGWWIRYVILKK
ncbi:MAG TPA: hypothetical protein VN181_15445, partial [Thermoanaerobaculia bacterium]|nr:hypothetical protein [Thermoanaerobaculia bacterium]